MGLSGGPNQEKTRKIKQVAIKSEHFLNMIKEFGAPEDSKIMAMSPIMLIISSEEFEEVPHGTKIPILEIEVEEFRELSLKDIGIV